MKNLDRKSLRFAVNKTTSAIKSSGKTNMKINCLRIIEREAFEILKTDLNAVKGAHLL